MSRNVLIGLDGSDSSWKAFDEAMSQAQLGNATLHVLSVQEELPVSPNAMEILTLDNAANEHSAKLYSEAERRGQESGIKMLFVTRSGDPTRVLLDYAKEVKADLLVIGKRGQSSVWSALIGGGVDKVVREAHCSVLVVR